MAEQFSNFATTTLNGAIDNAVTSIVVTSATPFPATTQYRITIDTEIMIVTGGAGTTTWTVTRGAESTSAASHSNGAAVSHTLTAGALNTVVTRALALSLSGSLGATYTDAADFIVAIPFDMTLYRMKATCRLAPAGSMAVQLRLSTNATTPSYSNVTGFVTTFTGTQTSAIVDPTNVDVSEGNLLNVSVSTGSGYNLLVEIVGVPR